MDGNDFVARVCKQLMQGLTANDELLWMTNNSALKGQFAEASLRQFIQRFVAPLRLSTGSIIYEENCGDDVPQLDGIIWQPSPLPAVLEAGDFAIVPRATALAYLEIKRSNYSDTGAALKRLLDREDELVPLLEGIAVWDGVAPRRAMGVICLYDESESDGVLKGLIAEGRVALLLRRKDGGTPYEPDPNALLTMSHFLMGVRRRALITDGIIRVKMTEKIPCVGPGTQPTVPSTTECFTTPKKG